MLFSGLGRSGRQLGFTPGHLDFNVGCAGQQERTWVSLAISHQFEKE